MIWCMMMEKEMIEEVGIIGGLIVVQFAYAGNSVLLSYLMSLGIDAVTIVIFCNFATFLILTPLAFLFEREQWPRSLSLKLAIKLVLISFGGVTLFQTLYLQGIKLTSPSIATAMPNLSPGFIFIIAWIVRMEKVKLSCLYSRVKIGGTALCVIGAFTMSLMHSTASSSTSVKEVNDLSSFPSDVVFDKDKIIGCIYLLASVFILSTNIVLQASTLSEFPAPISLCAATSLIGVFITGGIQISVYQEMEPGWPFITINHLIAFSVLGGVVNGASVSFCGWALRKKGPVLVSLFSPIATVISLVLSVVTLGEKVHLGSIAGMCLMFAGLYFVLWAKGKENYSDEDVVQRDEYGPEKPLLA